MTTDSERSDTIHLGSELLAIATMIAHVAGAHALERIRASGARAAVRARAEVKSSKTDLVTEVDRETEAIIVEHLQRLRPHDGIIGEEGTNTASTSGVTWILDPIDGTTNFVYGHGSFAVSIAAYRGEVGLAGVVYDPIRAETFTASWGAGAALNGLPLTVPAQPAVPSEVLLGTGFHYLASRRLRQARLLETILPAVRDIRRQGTASLDCCSVAAGRLDAYYEAALKPWDIAAGLIIATEAGYVTTTLNLGPELEETLLVTHSGLLESMRDLLDRAAGAVGSR